MYLRENERKEEGIAWSFGRGFDYVHGSGESKSSTTMLYEGKAEKGFLNGLVCGNLNDWKAGKV